MLHNKIHIYPEPEMTAEAVAELIVTKQKSKTAEGGSFAVAVSGGSTPKLLFEILAERYLQAMDWSKLKLFWVDERCVPPDHKESNYRMTHESLLKKTPIPEKNIFRMRGEQNPSAEAKRYAEILENELPKKNELPFFDLILLGMGEDGHTASIFPDNLELLHSPETVATCKQPQTGQSRITLTGNVICNAGQVAFVVTGHSKAETLDAIMNERDDFERYPAYYILAGCNAELYLDNGAAERL